MPADCVSLSRTPAGSATELMRLNRYVNLLIPGRRLIRPVVENATVPVIETGVGNCHVCGRRDLDMVVSISNAVHGSRMQRHGDSPCGLLHCGRFLPIWKPADEYSVELQVTGNPGDTGPVWCRHGVDCHGIRRLHLPSRWSRNRRGHEYIARWHGQPEA